MTFKMDWFIGNIRKDYFGNIIVDECESDNDHLVNAPTNPETNKPSCRKVVNHMFDEFLGKKGHLTVNIEFEEDSDDC